MRPLSVQSRAQPSPLRWPLHFPRLSPHPASGLARFQAFAFPRAPPAALGHHRVVHHEPVPFPPVHAGAGWGALPAMRNTTCHALARPTRPVPDAGPPHANHAGRSGSLPRRFMPGLHVAMPAAMKLPDVLTSRDAVSNGPPFPAFASSLTLRSAPRHPPSLAAIPGLGIILHLSVPVDGSPSWLRGTPFPALCSCSLEQKRRAVTRSLMNVHRLSTKNHYMSACLTHIMNQFLDHPGRAEPT